MRRREKIMGKESVERKRIREKWRMMEKERER